MTERRYNTRFSKIRQKILQLIQSRPGISTSVTHFKREIDEIEQNSRGYKAFKYCVDTLEEDGQIKIVKGRFYPLRDN